MDKQHQNLNNILALDTRGVDSVDRFRGPPALYAWREKWWWDLQGALCSCVGFGQIAFFFFFFFCGGWRLCESRATRWAEKSIGWLNKLSEWKNWILTYFYYLVLLHNSEWLSRVTNQISHAKASLQNYHDSVMINPKQRFYPTPSIHTEPINVFKRPVYPRKTSKRARQLHPPMQTARVQLLWLGWE